MQGDGEKSDKYRDVFISYSSVNVDLAKELERAITEAGGTVFLSAKHIPYGSDFAENIREQLISSRQLWIIVSPESLKSEWVLTEFGAAWILGKTIIPILFRCGENDLPDRLKRLQCVDFHKYPELIAQTFFKKQAVSVPTEEERAIINDLLSRGRIIDAVAEGRTYLARRQYDNSLNVLEYIKNTADPHHRDYYIILGNIAYNLIHLNKDTEALEYLEIVEKLCPEPFFPWHAIARAAAYLHLNNEAECIRWVEYAQKHPKYEEGETRKHYPELISYLHSSSS